jgi:hypothetical protein
MRRQPCRSRQTARRRQLILVDIHGDDAAGSGDTRTLNRGQADASGAEDRDRRSGLHFGGVQHRTHAGHHRASDQRGGLQRHVVGNFDEAVFVGEHFLREAGRITRYSGNPPALI